ncbi:MULTISPECIES: ubiquinol-cytochrome c reductase iron-sulfur subunit [Halomonadaceae]|uniref:Ubiquinol-cytochrome c reductase iron-sulfur subunit n=1 Tax=Modicisalibacter ilicicola DSM 19980 TaxID=1121942 RepID=A0A1M5EY45_9GAMM|nr:MULTISPECIES: ubiquinol-cytochrome c reductase iron-sulfur subunit [Halomonas]SHF84193.1 ubiquinol-cytochrome c reductase iron-sulfur subunit [Halomonas ilicicola DSM 19980]
MKRRRFLVGATVVVGAVGAAFTAVPFIASWQPSARARAAGAPVEVDIDKLEPGQQVTVEWRGKPIWVLRRTPTILERLATLTESGRLRDPLAKVATQQPGYISGPLRAIKEEYLVVIGICTHLGCVPSFRPEPGSVGDDWPGGYFCPCHGSKFDFAGRVFKAVPAPTNLEIPPYRFLSESRVEIGTDPEPTSS